MSSPSVGAHLRRLREGRGVSLEEIARATRVSSGYLHALEADDFASLPVPVFTRGFIRAYCQTHGEAAEPALGLYDARSDPTPAMAEASAAAPSRPASSRIAAASAPTPKNRGPLLISFVLLVVLGIALFAVTLMLQSGRDPAGAGRAAASRPATVAPAPSLPSGASTGESSAGSSVPAAAAPASAPASPVPPAAPPASASAPSGPATGAPSATASAPVSAPGPVGSAPAPAPSPPGDRVHRLIARTTQPTWIRVRTEDGRVTEETIPANQVREWHSTGPFRVTVGNAGGVALELNGRAVPPLGASGAVVPNIVLPTEGQ
jgi:cytoskeleton protein RodZ